LYIRRVVIRTQANTPGL